ncbi:MAG: molybdopterin molybdotransferase MoeA [Thermoflexales bacterium]
MRKLALLPPSQAVAEFNAVLDAAWRPLPAEIVPVVEARGRVLACDVIAPISMPEFRRSSVDGYAVCAASVPGVLCVVGEVQMGRLSPFAIHLGEAALVHTGAHVPEGADAVVMLEDTQPVADASQTEGEGARRILVAGRVSVGDNIIQQGEDVRAGDTVLRAGTRLREQEIGGCLALGITHVEVYRRPRVAFIASGNELVPPEHVTLPGQVRNINVPMLAALAARHGAEPLDFGILPDQPEAFEQAARRALQEADAVVFIAGSSVGPRDFVAQVVERLGRPGVIAHGILFRPGKPTLFAVCDGKPVFGLPGNPISALVTANLFLVPTLWRLQRVSHPPRPHVVRAVLASEMRSPRNLEHWFPVTLDYRAESSHPSPLPLAIPIVTKSNLIFGLARAHGLACAPIGVDVLPAATELDVRLME